MVTVKQAGDANWACAALSLVILLIRLAVYRNRKNTFDVSSILSAASTLIVSIRIGVNYYLLKCPGANYQPFTSLASVDAPDDAMIKTSSILAIAGRLLITTYIWLQLSLLLLFYSPIVGQQRWVANTIKFCWLTIFASYVAVVLTTCLECRPFKLYWQVKPHPDRCLHAYAQLFVQCIANIVVDLILLVIGLPIILTFKNGSLAERFRLVLITMLGTLCITFTCIRLYYIYGSNPTQAVRSFWASLQMLLSTVVAHAPTIYGSVKLIQRHKSEKLARRASRPESWGVVTGSASRESWVTAEDVESSSKFVPDTQIFSPKVFFQVV